MDPVVVALINFGVLGIVFVLFLTGWLEAKPSIDERKTRETEQRLVIKELTGALNHATDAMETSEKIHHGGS